MNSKIIIGILLLIIFLGGCTSNNENFPSGMLQGHISIGPICPVERNPPDPNCLPTLETYLAHPLEIFSITNSTKRMAEVVGNAQGNYSIQLPAGNYVIQSKQIGIGGLPRMAFTIKANEITTLNLDIDTGIR